VSELALHDIDAERREIVGGMAEDAGAPALRTASSSSPAISTARSTAPISCSSRSASAVRRPALGRGRSRSPAAASGRRRPAPAASRRRCAPCRSCSRSPSACRELAAPDAWIVDFTNPVGIVTRALLDAGHRAVGLCNVAIGFQRSFARHLGVEPPSVVVDQVGLNHLTWIRAVRVDGRDVLPELLAEHGDAIAEQAALPLRLLEELGVVPSSTSSTSTATTRSWPSSSTGRRAPRSSPRSSAGCSSSTATRV
jgi:6-phospho-beta-glucosidase